MVKGWGDADSSDDEDDLVERVEALEVAEETAPAVAEDPPHEPPRKPRDPVEFPDHPPFKAYVGNLDYQMKDAAELRTLLEQAYQLQCGGQELVILDVHIPIDRNTQRARGFSYVEVETLDMLKNMILQLNDHEMAGRKLNMNVAKQQQNKGGRHHSGGRSNVDGSKFRGGSFRSEPRGERPSLKLAPRTKPLEDEKEGASSSRTDIFGGAKARDEKSWIERRQSDREARQGRGGGRGEGRGGRGEGRGGRGEGRGGRGEGRGGGRGEARRSSGRGGEKKPEKKPYTPPQEAPKPAEKKAPQNKFAALGFDSDSD